MCNAVEEGSYLRLMDHSIQGLREIKEERKKKVAPRDS